MVYLSSTFTKYGFLKSHEKLEMCFTLGVDTNFSIIITKIPKVGGAVNHARIPRHLLRKGDCECGVPFCEREHLEANFSFWNYLSFSTNCLSSVLEKTLKKSCCLADIRSIFVKFGYKVGNITKPKSMYLILYFYHLPRGIASTLKTLLKGAA